MGIGLEILIRSATLFFISLFFIRLMSKRNLSSLSPFNFVNYTAIAIIASLISVRIIANLALGFLALGTWILLPIVLDYLSLKSKWVHDLINGKETVLIKQGRIMEKNLIKARLTGEELLSALRRKNAFNIADVEFAVMESSGDINILLKSDKKPVTAHDLGKKVASQEEPQTVILDGNILDEPLSNAGLNQGWLKTQLEVMGVSLDNVFIGQVDSSGDLYVDLFDDSIEAPIQKTKELLYANLEKCHADLMTFALETEDKTAKAIYYRDSGELKKLVEKLKPYLH